MRSGAGFVAAALVAIALTGCAAAAPETASAPGEAVESDAPSVTPAPATLPPADDEEPSKDEYLAAFFESSLVAQMELTDEQKLAAAEFACQEVEAGNMSPTAIEGTTDQFNRYFTSAAVTYVCPDLSEVYAAG